MSKSPGVTIPACSPTDDPAWWRMGIECDTDPDNRSTT